MQQKTKELLNICVASGKSMQEAQFAVDPTVRGLFDRCGELKIEIEAMDAQIKHIQSQQASEDEWDTPLPLNSSLPPVKALTKELIPESLRGWLVDVADRMQIPLEFAAVPCLVILGSLIGRKIGIYPKAYDTWIVFGNLWGKLIGRPSLLKSPAINEIRAPLEKLIADAAEAHQSNLAKFEEDQSWTKARKSAHEEELKKAAKNKGPRPENTSIEEPPEPHEKRFITNESTVEKIGEILLQNPQGILLLRDELFGWIRLLEKPGREGDRQFYLEAWNGAGSFTVDRIGRGTLRIPALCLSVLGAITPGPLSKYVLSTLSGGCGDDGLLQRFQLAVWPDVSETWENVDRPPDKKAKEKAFKIFENIGNFAPGKDQVSGVNFTPDAQQIFNAWREKLERRLRTGELTASMESHLGKFRSLVPKLALIFHVAETIGCQQPLSAVGVGELSLAIQWAEYLESHAFRIYHPADPGVDSAKALLEKIRGGHLQDGFSIRNIYHGRHWAHLENAEKAETGARILEDNGWVRCQVTSTGGRPTTKVNIHPSLKKNPQNEAGK
jgi:putative DNA primase/helicase